MEEKLDIIIVDDDKDVCNVMTKIIKSFYVWGKVSSFTDVDEAIRYCQKGSISSAIFVLDVNLGRETAFTFLNAISDKITMAYEDAIIITGNASDDVVDTCIDSGITHLLEKPVKPYALQLAVRSIVTRYLRYLNAYDYIE
ncbi:MAG: response regulator [Pseudomonadota bacterium]